MGFPLVLVLAWSGSAPAMPQDPAAPPVTQAAIDAAIDKGCAWLLEHEDAAFRQGERALSIYAALHGGADPETPQFHEFAASLREAEFSQTYDSACVICALVELDPVRYRDVIDRAAEALQRFQNERGAWGYPSGEDLSNTQYAALGLWKAAQVGYPVDARIWDALHRRVADYQNEDGGFGYQSSSRSTPSMTVAGVGTLALCESQLRLARGLESRVRESLAKQRVRGLGWIEDQVPVGRADLGSWSGYTLYGLERCAAWLGMTRIGAHDWYRRGAIQLLAQQLPDGSWGGRVETAFAVLFLARATSGPGPQQAVTPGLATEASARPELRVASSTYGALAVEGFGPRVTVRVAHWDRVALRELARRGEEGRGPRVRCVEYTIDGHPVAVQLFEPAQPIDDRRFATELWVPGRGEFALGMRLILEDRAGVSQRERAAGEDVLELGPVGLVALHGLDRPRHHDLPALHDFSLSRAAPRVSVSSRLASQDGLIAGKHSGAESVDGDLNTAWFGRPGDEKRRWSGHWSQPLLVDEILVHLAPAVPGGRALARPRLIEVRFADGTRAVLVVEPGARSGRLHLAEPRTLDALELRIISLDQPDEDRLAPFGFAEVELRTRA